MDPVAFYDGVGDLFQAVAFSFLFWPKFITFHDAVFIALNGDDERFIINRLTDRNGKMISRSRESSWQEAVDSFNWVEVAHLFIHWRGPQEYHVDAEDFLGEVLCQAWSAKLKKNFPERDFSVFLDEPEDSSTSLTINIKQVSPVLEDPPSWNRKLGIFE